MATTLRRPEQQHTQELQRAFMRHAPTHALAQRVRAFLGLNATWPCAQGEKGPMRPGSMGSTQLLLSGKAVSPPLGTSESTHACVQEQQGTTQQLWPGATLERA